MIVVADSGPLIHLACVKQFSLLRRFFHILHTIPQVYEEVVARGEGRADDLLIREMARQENLAVMGTVGILVQARVEGLVDTLQPLLDQLIATGFYLDPAGRVYQNALKEVGEL